jgi:hypothetical protein
VSRAIIHIANKPPLTLPLLTQWAPTLSPFYGERESSALFSFSLSPLLRGEGWGPRRRRGRVRGAAAIDEVEEPA